MIRLATAGALALVLAVAGLAMAKPAAAAHHEAVIQVVTVDVKPGKLEKYQKQVKKLAGIMERLGSRGSLRMWRATTGGPDTGQILVALEFANAAAWAADTTKMQNDEEWQKTISGLDDLRTVESNSVWRDISPTPAAAGSGALLAITGVTVNPGKLDAYRKRVDGARSITERLGLSGTLRMWHAELAGPNTGAVAVGVEYPDLATYVADQGKLAMDSEWRKLISGLDSLRTLNGRWLYQEITP